MSTEAAPTPAPPINPNAPQQPPKSKLAGAIKGAIAKHDVTTKSFIPTPTPAAIAPAEPKPPTQPDTAKPAVAETPALPDPTPVPKADDLPETITEKNMRENWAAARKKLAALETQNKTLSEQSKAKDDEIVKYRTKPEVSKEFQEELSTAKKERDEFSTLVERIAIEKHPKFKAHFDARFEEVIKTAKNAAGDKSDKVLAILEAQPSQWRKAELNGIYADMDEADKMSLAVAVNEYDKVRNEKAAHLENSKEEAKKVAAMEEKQRVDALGELEKTIQSTVKTAAQEYESFKSDDSAKESEATLRKILSGKSDRDTFIQTVVKGIDFARLKAASTKDRDALTKENAELKSAMAELTKANPNVRTAAGKQPAPEVRPGPWGSNKVFQSAVKALAEGPK